MQRERIRTSIEAVRKIPKENQRTHETRSEIQQNSREFLQNLKMFLRFHEISMAFPLRGAPASRYKLASQHGALANHPAKNAHRRTKRPAGEARCRATSSGRAKRRNTSKHIIKETMNQYELKLNQLESS